MLYLLYIHLSHCILNVQQTFLPSLEDLTVTYNRLTKLERDFHGLPALCKADLSYNQIHTISTVLVDKTQCQMHGVNRTLNIYLNGKEN